MTGEVDIKPPFRGMETAIPAPAVLHRRRQLLERGAAVLTALTLGIPLTGCAQNEYTGRSQLILISPEEVERMADLSEPQVRAAMGGPLRDRAKQRAIERMVDRMAAVPGAPRPRRGFRAEMIANPAPNAFALPNGYTGYHEGLWQFVNGREDDLAHVMGHEMGHVAGRHQAERISQALALQLGVAVIRTIVVSQIGYSPAIGAALGLGTALGGSAFSRSHEHEADRLGMLYATRAGYDPLRGPALFDQLERRFGNNPMAFISTHPSHGDRRERLARLIEEDPEIQQAIQARSDRHERRLRATSARNI